MGARSALRLGLTDEQPVLCAEPRGPGSLSREEEEAQDRPLVRGFSRRREEEEGAEEETEEGGVGVTVF